MRKPQSRSQSSPSATAGTTGVHSKLFTAFTSNTWVAILFIVVAGVVAVLYLRKNEVNAVPSTGNQNNQEIKGDGNVQIKGNENKTELHSSRDQHLTNGGIQIAININIDIFQHNVQPSHSNRMTGEYHLKEQDSGVSVVRTLSPALAAALSAPKKVKQDIPRSELIVSSAPLC